MNDSIQSSTSLGAVVGIAKDALLFVLPQNPQEAEAASLIFNSADNIDIAVGFNATEEGVKHNPYALIFAIIPLLTIFGNGLVILAVCFDRSLQTVTNLLIVSLAVSDFMVAMCVMSFAVYIRWNSFVWDLGPTLCNLYIGIDVTCSTASILNLLTISIDRYIAITHPLAYCQYGANQSRAYMSIAFVWSISVGVGLPVFFGANHIEDGREQLCEFTNAYFIIGSSILSFFAPCIAMIILYAVIFRRLHEREKARLQRHNRTKKRHIVQNEVISTALLGGTRVARQLGQHFKSRADQLILELSLQTSSHPTGSFSDESDTSGGSSGSKNQPHKKRAAFLLFNGVGPSFGPMDLERLPNSVLGQVSRQNFRAPTTTKLPPAPTVRLKLAERLRLKRASSLPSTLGVRNHSVAPGQINVAERCRKGRGHSTCVPPAPKDFVNLVQTSKIANGLESAKKNTSKKALKLSHSISTNGTSPSPSLSLCSLENDPRGSLVDTPAAALTTRSAFSFGEDYHGTLRYIDSLSLENYSLGSYTAVKKSSTHSTLRQMVDSRQRSSLEVCGYCPYDEKTPRIEFCSSGEGNVCSEHDVSSGVPNGGVPRGQHARCKTMKQQTQTSMGRFPPPRSLFLTISKAGNLSLPNLPTPTSITLSPSPNPFEESTSMLKSISSCSSTDEIPDYSSRKKKNGKRSSKTSDGKSTKEKTKETYQCEKAEGVGLLGLLAGCLRRSTKFEFGGSRQSSNSQEGGQEQDPEQVAGEAEAESLSSGKGVATKMLDTIIAATPSLFLADRNNNSTANNANVNNAMKSSIRSGGSQVKESASWRSSLGRQSDIWSRVRTTFHVGSDTSRRPSKQLLKKASKQMRREHKATVTLAIVLAVFLCCWVPFFSLHLCNAICLLVGNGGSCVHYMAMFLTTWLGYLNSSLNPLIYTVFDQRFRKAFKTILCFGQDKKKSNRQRLDK